MMRKWLCQADVAVHLEPVDPVLIKSGYATLDGPDMVPVQTLRDGKETYYFPGTSLKGVLRSHFERIARTLRKGSVCLPYYDPKKAKDIPLPVDTRAEREAAVGCGYRTGRNPERQHDRGRLPRVVRRLPAVRFAPLRRAFQHRRRLPDAGRPARPQPSQRRRHRPLHRRNGAGRPVRPDRAGGRRFRDAPAHRQFRAVAACRPALPAGGLCRTRSSASARGAAADSVASRGP